MDKLRYRTELLRLLARGWFWDKFEDKGRAVANLYCIFRLPPPDSDFKAPGIPIPKQPSGAGRPYSDDHLIL